MQVLLATEGQEGSRSASYFRWFEISAQREPAAGEGLWVGKPGEREKFIVAEVTFEEGRPVELQVDLEGKTQTGLKEFSDLPAQEELEALGFAVERPD